MNRFLERLAIAYAPLGQRGLLFDGQYRFAEKTSDDVPPAERRNVRPARASTASTLRIYARTKGIAR
ncbi:hypothetical protein EC912_106249 [Luteibacter rhizovicinus]|uniref:Uncharacterized protein n=1 Tax=Luteibacter rhizovicinus TaxID=242606 RepID=A0A4R3YKY0_9GAMM|nr:hypothetical protein [Luteibacter rhizovicinus]TCV92910.1 hypothetical protein EC912_106249 [Luteibacter rhizovicinus]